MQGTGPISVRFRESARAGILAYYFEERRAEWMNQPQWRRFEMCLVAAGSKSRKRRSAGSWD
ncbi:protein of unknown function [Kyrpidia spormannii]|uniref:Uncharacterized protein n=1 Tax=Kyrpidia spormannii TaxID=2055160 RepID=A0A6F9E7T7_9BACL|nr:protein of unknown function [Kyrpidia spormannii]